MSGLANSGDSEADISVSDLVLHLRMLKELIRFPLEKLEPNTGRCRVDDLPPKKPRLLIHRYLLTQCY